MKDEIKRMCKDIRYIQSDFNSVSVMYKAGAIK